jgi:hypothetical protein
MERFDIENNSPPLVVLDGQTSLEELFAELGFEWRVEPDLSASAGGGSAMYGQPTLF